MRYCQPVPGDGLVGVRMNHQSGGPVPGASRRLSNAGTKAGMVLLLPARDHIQGPSGTSCSSTSVQGRLPGLTGRMKGAGRSDQSASPDAALQDSMGPRLELRGRAAGAGMDLVQGATAQHCLAKGWG